MKKKKNSVGSSIAAVIGVLLCLLLLPVLLANLTLIYKSYVSSDVPDVFGYIPQIVLTGSMEPGIVSGDLIISQKTDPESIKEGDVISFFDPSGNGSTIITHRVVKKSTRSDGTVTWTTKGDANNIEDTPIGEDALVARFTGIRLPRVGTFAMFSQTTEGMLICIVCPLMLLIALSIIGSRKREREQQAEKEALEAEIAALRGRRG